MNNQELCILLDSILALLETDNVEKAKEVIQNCIRRIDKGTTSSSEKQKAGENMPNTAETIEILARKLERVRILNDLKECNTLEEYQELVKKYEKLCNDDKA